MGARPAHAALLCAAAGWLAQAVLPPGYQDELFCPQGYCRQQKKTAPGFAGPMTAFFDCVREADNNVGPVVVPTTPWGTLMGEEEKDKLLSSGFSSSLCPQTSAEDALTDRSNKASPGAVSTTVESSVSGKPER
mmetsp:Transcript_18763/g.53013  ORF Transcript_18763/g.53013 Transcript_18763/m.53013 type:complete len:134 (+) Transcript_18763:51-452(+)